MENAKEEGERGELEKTLFPSFFSLFFDSKK